MFDQIQEKTSVSQKEQLIRDVVTPWGVTIMPWWQTPSNETTQLSNLKVLCCITLSIILTAVQTDASRLSMGARSNFPLLLVSIDSLLDQRLLLVLKHFFLQLLLGVVHYPL